VKWHYGTYFDVYAASGDATPALSHLTLLEHVALAVSLTALPPEPIVVISPPPLTALILPSWQMGPHLPSPLGEQQSACRRGISPALHFHRGERWFPLTTIDKQLTPHTW